MADNESRDLTRWDLEDLIERLHNCGDDQDQERGRLEASLVLCQALIKIGYWDIVDAWEKVCLPRPRTPKKPSSNVCKAEKMKEKFAFKDKEGRQWVVYS